ncbi:glucosamine-6-phosphate deaminase [Ornithinimicrobium sp. Y1694]|uniref:glucosamine-6-phosphate deaminase n=1 Tax=Ornithinimicrobium sp. Y1694 TaxID=3418590 RepID=UPI003CE67A78
MEVVICSDADEIGRLGGQAIADLVSARPGAVLGLATGSSPRPVYADVLRRVDADEVSLKGVSTFSLDEYVGLPEDHPVSYRAEIRRVFTDAAGIPADRVHTPRASADDVEAAAQAYEDAIRDAGGIDLQLVGLGTEGHIAFNEPGSSLASRTRIKTLTEQTRSDNARFFDGDVSAVPHHCLTVGLATILDTRHVIVIATGESKAKAVAQLVEGAVSARWPATVLQAHPHVTVLLDEAAASGLELADYYRYAWEHKPGWQGP